LSANWGHVIARHTSWTTFLILCTLSTSN
jgi:hypothetical protein